MAKVQARSCPTCGHDKGKTTDFEVAEVPVIGTAELTSLQETIQKLPSQFPKPVELPPTLTETLEAVAKAGERLELVAQNWETKQLAEAEAMKESPGHPPPTPELIESWRTCTNCAPSWQKIWDGIANEARKGYVPSDEAQEAIAEVARQLTATKGRA